MVADGFEAVDVIDFRDDGVEYAAVVLCGRVVACSARLFQGSGGAWPGLGRKFVGTGGLGSGGAGACFAACSDVVHVACVVVPVAHVVGLGLAG